MARWTGWGLGLVLACGCGGDVRESGEGGTGGAADVTATTGDSATSTMVTAQSGAVTSGVTGPTASNAASTTSSASSTSSGAVSPECRAFSSIHVVSATVSAIEGGSVFAPGSEGTLQVRWRNDGPEDYPAYPGLRYTSAILDPTTGEDMRFAIFSGMENESIFPFRVAPDAPTGTSEIVVEIITLGDCPITEVKTFDLVVDP